MRHPGYLSEKRGTLTAAQGEIEWTTQSLSCFAASPRWSGTPSHACASTAPRRALGGNELRPDARPIVRSQIAAADLPFGEQFDLDTTDRGRKHTSDPLAHEPLRNTQGTSELVLRHSGGDKEVS